jgi:glucosamine 6-phosphate synthetase-like amidotransferase/phosphosugar isomerase protein
MMAATKTVKCVYGDTHVIEQVSFDNPQKMRIKLLETTNPNVDLNDGQSHVIHRENIILDDTIGFQITNEDAECFEHESFEIIESLEKAHKMLCKAVYENPEHNWRSIQIAKDTIQNPEFI